MVASLQKWLPSVCTEIADAGGIELEQIQSWNVFPTEEAPQAGAFPTVVVSSPGIARAPEIAGDGSIRLTWTVVVSVFTRGDDWADTVDRKSDYALAVMVAVLQHPDLGGIADAAWLVDVDLAPLPTTAGRTLQGCHVQFSIATPNAISVLYAPDEPPPDGETSPEPATIVDRDIDLIKEPE